jgi:hypothetical protein
VTPADVEKAVDLGLQRVRAAQARAARITYITTADEARAWAARARPDHDPLVEPCCPAWVARRKADVNRRVAELAPFSQAWWTEVGKGCAAHDPRSNPSIGYCTCITPSWPPLTAFEVHHTLSRKT